MQIIRGLGRKISVRRSSKLWELSEIDHRRNNDDAGNVMLKLALGHCKANPKQGRNTFCYAMNEETWF